MTNEELATELERLGLRLLQNPNTGHGHVYPRPDGVRARCGGPHMCSECALDFVRKSEAGPVGVPAPLLAAVISALRKS